MKRRDVIIAVGTASLLPLVPGAARAAAAAGNVVGLLGQCLVERQGGGSTALKLGDAVDVADTLVVPADGKLKLRMADGSVVSLAAGTRMTVAAYQTGPGGERQNAQLALSGGLLRAVVSQVDHPASFEVSTAVGTAAVRSTDWFIEAKPGSAQVGVLTGSVSLTSRATGRSELIPSRWGARLEAGRDPVPARLWAPQEFQAVIARTDVP
ncbi:MAG TPA: FecR family protein [Stellaceae bacterium]|nr:FecR family protein [Stellaceae bacterium]